MVLLRLCSAQTALRRPQLQRVSGGERPCSLLRFASEFNSIRLSLAAQENSHEGYVLHHCHALFAKSELLTLMVVGTRIGDSRHSAQIIFIGPVLLPPSGQQCSGDPLQWMTW